jgi:hypothetical protein
MTPSYIGHETTVILCTISYCLYAFVFEFSSNIFSDETRTWTTWISIKHCPTSTVGVAECLLHLPGEVFFGPVLSDIPHNEDFKLSRLRPLVLEIWGLRICMEHSLNITEKENPEYRMARLGHNKAATRTAATPHQGHHRLSPSDCRVRYLPALPLGGAPRVPSVG